jgi:hypothetical protein
VCAKWESMWDRRDNQEVGLEAATLERVRNSSLFKWSCADNVAGLKHTAEAAATPYSVGLGVLGRGASCIRRSAGVTQVWRVWE